MASTVPYQDISPASTPGVPPVSSATPSLDWTAANIEEARILETARKQARIEETRRKLDLEQALLTQQHQQLQLQRSLAATPPGTADQWLSRRMLDPPTPAHASSLLKQYPMQEALWADHMSRRLVASTPAHQVPTTSWHRPVTPGVGTTQISSISFGTSPANPDMLCFTEHQFSGRAQRDHPPQES